MSWDPQSGDPSPAADPATGRLDLEGAELIQAHGATLLDALESHYPGAHGHADATASYAFAAGVQLGFEREHAEAVRETARLHEVGMIYVPVAVLTVPPGERSADQRALIASHPAYGVKLARGAGVPEHACGWIGASAERFDGAGPAGLAGERIPLESRIIRVACAYDAAVTASDAERSASEHRAAAFAQLRDAGGTELDPRVVQALTAILGRVTQ
jgi:HD-GYP domain-containing protein (c-di-GMP phosphodiesterase class II)